MNSLPERSTIQKKRNAAAARNQSFWTGIQGAFLQNLRGKVMFLFGNVFHEVTNVVNMLCVFTCCLIVFVPIILSKSKETLCVCVCVGAVPRFSIFTSHFIILVHTYGLGPLLPSLSTSGTGIHPTFRYTHVIHIYIYIYILYSIYAYIHICIYMIDYIILVYIYIH